MTGDPAVAGTTDQLAVARLGGGATTPCATGTALCGCGDVSRAPHQDDQAPALDGPRRERLRRHARWLAYGTLAYNAAEAAVAIGAGSDAGSFALVSFGGDSLVECLSAIMIIWQFRSAVPEDRERQALRGIAVAFFVLAAWVTVDAGRGLLTGADPDASPVGIALAAVSLVVMPLLALAKRRVAAALGSASVAADGMQTMLCTYLSAVLLLGLLANATLGWAWADPVAALVIAAVAVREGRDAWRGQGCDC
jgi:divalent metal cation (Fe/Co/Zn/Cd) transporter